MSLTVRCRTGLVVAWLAFAPAGCEMFGHPGPSAVAQGRYFASGNPDYDSFFVELHRLQVELKDAPDRVAAPRQELAKALDVGIDAVVIKEALAKRVSELGSKQVKLGVERGSDADASLSLKVTGNPSGDDADFVKSVGHALATMGELKGTIDGWQKSLDALPAQDNELLEGLDTAFASAPPGKRSDVKNNLTDGQKMIAVLEDRTHDAAHANSELLDAVVGALGETPASAEKPSEGSSEKTSSKTSERSEKKAHKAPPPPPPPKPTRAPKAAPPKAEPKAAPKAAPKPEPKPAEAKAPPKPAPAERSEVPPAPKPTQGTAKPDFEP
ncbi:MAG TPA: hypothetical protein VMI54_19140 [Polyangiaceae bacterium]|nr:hypothetical protein [Polyangiaceae bacterium]